MSIPLIVRNDSGIFHKLILSLMLLVAFIEIKAQDDTTKIFLTMESAVEMVLEHNLDIKNAKLNIDKSKAEKLGIFDFSPTEITYFQGQLHSSITDKGILVRQNFGSPLSHFYEGKLVDNKIKLSEEEYNIVYNKLIVDVKKLYNEWIYHIDRLKIMQSEFILYKRNYQYASSLQDTDSTRMYKISSEINYASAKNRLQHLLNELIIIENKFKILIHSEGNFVPAKDTLDLYRIPATQNHDERFSSEIVRRYYQSLYNIDEGKLKLEKSRYFPEIHAGYFNQEINGVNNFSGWNIGISVPLWFLPNKSAIETNRINLEKQKNELKHQEFRISKEIENLVIELNQYQNQLIYFYEKALPQTEYILFLAELQLESDRIDYEKYLESVIPAYKTKYEFIEVMKEYNEIAIELEFYTK